MSEALPACPTCSSDAVVKNGQTRHRKQNYKCRDCGRQFVEEPQWRAVSVEHRAIIDRLLLEKIPLPQTCLKLPGRPTPIISTQRET